MPKIVDHEQRRRQILEAVRRVLLREGLAGTTVRNVVAESGMSSGAIRHYFSDHRELLRFAAEGIAEQARQRVRTAYESRRTPRARAIAMLEELLPLDEERQMELSLNIDLFRVANDAEWGRRSWVGVRTVCRVAVVVLAGKDPVVAEQPLRPARLEHLAERLHLIVDGIAATSLLYGLTPPAGELRAGLVRGVDDVRRDLA